MEAARLALHAAYHPGFGSLPPVGDPEHVPDFLRYHIDPCVRIEGHTHAISSAMRAIDSAANNPTTTWGIENADEFLTGFHESTGLKQFKRWYGILWFHYVGLGSGIRESMDEITMNGDDRIDLK